jgi:hypothetical protein
MALAVGPGLNVGKAIMAGLVPAIHAAAPQSSRLQTSVSSEAYDEAAVFAWMAGSSPVMTKNRIDPELESSKRLTNPETKSIYFRRPKLTLGPAGRIGCALGARVSHNLERECGRKRFFYLNRT